MTCDASWTGGDIASGDRGETAETSVPASSGSDSEGVESTILRE
jgi:hypothetical protein